MGEISLEFKIGKVLLAMIYFPFLYIFLLFKNIKDLQEKDKVKKLKKLLK